jgi:hypothetical protein
MAHTGGIKRGTDVNVHYKLNLQLNQLLTVIFVRRDEAATTFPLRAYLKGVICLKKTTKWLLWLVPLVLILLFGLTSIPHHPVNLKPADVSRIVIFDGSTGREVEITEAQAIRHIVANLNEVTFERGKLSIGYLGFRFRTTLYNDRGKAIKTITINSAEVIRYRGFFYTASDKRIDFSFIEGLFK